MEQLWQVICSSEKLTKFSVTCQMCLDDILVAEYDADGKDHNDMSTTKMQGSQLKAKQRKVPFQVYICPILQRGNIKKWGTARPTKDQIPYGNATTPQKGELQAFLDIINYLGKFPPSMATICEPFKN